MICSLKNLQFMLVLATSVAVSLVLISAVYNAVSVRSFAGFDLLCSPLKYSIQCRIQLGQIGFVFHVNHCVCCGGSGDTDPKRKHIHTPFSEIISSV